MKSKSFFFFALLCLSLLFNSHIFALPVPAPTDLQIAAAANGIDVILNWSFIDPDSADGFVIYKNGIPFDSISTSFLWYNDFSAILGYYWVTAYKGGEESSPSNTVSDTIIVTPNVQIWEYFVPGEHAGFGWDTLTGTGKTYLCIYQNAYLIDFFLGDWPPLSIVSADEPPYSGEKTTHILNMGTSDFDIAPTSGYYNVEYVVEGNFYAINTEVDHWSKLHITVVDTVYPEYIVFDANYQLVPGLRVLGGMVGVKEEKQAFSKQKHILSVTPNPFAVKTEISIDMAGARRDNSDIGVEIFDVSGRLVENIPVRSEKIEIGDDLLPGVYFIKAKGFQSEKIIKLQ